MNITNSMGTSLLFSAQQKKKPTGKPNKKTPDKPKDELALTPDKDAAKLKKSNKNPDEVTACHYDPDSGFQTCFM